MRIHDAKQGTIEWVKARTGLPTASNFDQVVTPKTGKPSASALRYTARLFAEWYLDTSLEQAASDFMARGTDMEEEAVGWYEFEHDCLTSEVGLCLRDDGKCGASPDRLVGEDGLAEIKCPSAEIQATYIVTGPPEGYRCQVQGQLWITERAWCDLVLYHPSLPKIVRRYERDLEFIELLAAGVDEVIARLDALKLQYAADRERYLARQRDDLPAMMS